jgi:REP element-mobilizing transposase RayT
MVFSTKGREPLLDENILPRLHRYIGGIVRKRGGMMEAAGGTGDHVHLLFRLNADTAIADMARFVKANSSKWISQTFPGKTDFAWQTGYGAFSVSASQAAAVRRYIERQKEHHRRVSFQEEFLDFLEKHGVEYDERFLWK